MTPEQRDLKAAVKRRLHPTHVGPPVPDRWHHRHAVPFSLNTHIPPEGFRPEWAMCLTSRWTSFVVPTEVVLWDREPVQPNEGRLYDTNFVYHRERLWDDKWRFEFDRFLGLDAYGLVRYDRVLLAEFWQNQGSDGHIRYVMEGWMFVTTRSFAEAQRTIAKNYGARCASAQYALELLRGDRF